MDIKLPRAIEKDIIEFCNLNEITDVHDFLKQCLINGYSIAKYGISPKDNLESENKPFKQVSYDKELKDELKEKKNAKTKKAKEPEPIVDTNEENDKVIDLTGKPKKKIKIISND